MRLLRINAIDLYDWTEIEAASSNEGYGMVDRLIVDFCSGLNRFNLPGEALFVQLQDRVVVGVAGLNREPDPRYANAGRVRRLYVLPEYRNNGLARGLIDACVSNAATVFERITVNAGIPETTGFYEHFGFAPVHANTITHVKEL